MQNKITLRQRFRSSSLLVRAAVAEMVGRTDEAEATYGKIRAKFGMYKNIATYDVSRTSYALARAIYFANKYKDSKTGQEYGEDYLLGAPLGKPIINIAAAFAVGAPIQIVENQTVANAEDPNQEEDDLENPEPENPTIANVNQWLDENRNFIYMAVRNEFRDGDTFVVMEDDGDMIEIPPEDVDIIQNPNNPDIIDGYDIFTTIDDPEDKTGLKTITYVDEIRRVYRRRTIQDEAGNRTEVPGTLVEYRSLEDGGLEERDLPVVHFANEKEARSLYGVSEFQSLYFLMANYHAVLAAAIKGNIYNSSAVPVVQGVENMKQFLEQNFRKDADGNYVLKWDSDKMLVVGKGGTVQMLQANGTAADAQTLLEVLFWLIAQNSETPEFAFGTAVQSSKASVSEQTPMLVKKAIRKQGQLEEPIRKLIDLYIQRMAELRPEEFQADTQFTIDMPDILDKDLNVNQQIVNTLLEKGIITEETALVMLNIGKYVKDLAKELKKAKLQKEARNPIPTDVFGSPINNQDEEDEEVNKVAKQAEIDEMKQHDDTKYIAEMLENRINDISLKTIQEMNPYREKNGRFGNGPAGGSKGTNPKGGAGDPNTIDGVETYADLPDPGLDGFQGEFRPEGDPAMTALAKKLGYDKKPSIIKESEVAALKEQGYIEMYRGYRGKDAQKHMKNFADSANFRQGYGVFGSGTYMTPLKDIGTFYGDMNPKNVGRYLISPKAKGISYEDAKKAMLKGHTSIMKKYSAAIKAKTGTKLERLTYSNRLDSGIKKIYSDAGRWAAANGYDYISYAGSSGGTEMAVLNRGVVGVVR